MFVRFGRCKGEGSVLQESVDKHLDRFRNVYTRLKTFLLLVNRCLKNKIIDHFFARFY